MRRSKVHPVGSRAYVVHESDKEDSDFVENDNTADFDSIVDSIVDEEMQLSALSDNVSVENDDDEASVYEINPKKDNNKSTETESEINNDGEGVAENRDDPPWSSEDFARLAQVDKNFLIYKYLRRKAVTAILWEFISTRLDEMEGEDLLDKFKEKEIKREKETYSKIRQPVTGTDTEIVRHRATHPKVVLNIGGEKHEVMWSLLQRKPRTRLGKLSKAYTHEQVIDLVDDYNLETNEFFVDRDPITFNTVLNLYRTDRLHLLNEVCIQDYSDDLHFWGIEMWNLEACCYDKYTVQMDQLLKDIKKEERLYEKVEVEVDQFGASCISQFQKRLWNLFEKPQSSRAAFMLSIISMSAVLVSTMGFVLNTFSWMQVEDEDGNLSDNPYLGAIEAVCISFFTLEYFLRLVGSPKKCAFIKGGMNIIDVLAIAPYWIGLIFIPKHVSTNNDCAGDVPVVGNTTQPCSDTSTFGSFSKVMQVFRIARVTRIFKLARRSVGLQAMAYTVRTSWKDLGLLFVLILMAMLLFGSMAYYIENAQKDTGFYSIPQGMWWAVQTLTSVGYGDFTTETIAGKLVGSFCATCGILVLALPIPIIVDNFGDYYEEEKKFEARRLKKEAREKEREIERVKARILVDGLVDSLSNSIGPYSPVINNTVAPTWGTKHHPDWPGVSELRMLQLQKANGHS